MEKDVRKFWNHTSSIWNTNFNNWQLIYGYT